MGVRPCYLGMARHYRTLAQLAEGRNSTLAGPFFIRWGDAAQHDRLLVSASRQNPNGGGSGTLNRKYVAQQSATIC
uniref:Uncharacterized protein n=1 Tax=Candidatus Kentrum sp. DK TaxID=2126562 RepID=A0A450SB25_9GAMM|nr:MAG: hypothetical protein BECKDK2373C_GA0170839_10257 [Candidatus Kentron sp. DK]